jgi:hypothetical protein
MEKQILRDSFVNYLPNEILYRKKEQFSDGVSEFNKNNNYHFTYIILFCYISVILALIYYILNYIHIINVGKGLNAINRIFYTNINNDFINGSNLGKRDVNILQITFFEYNSL